ncbi:MAG: (d)CMP kinase [Fusobacteriota bacterium]
MSFIVAIDGPAGSGKSTISKRVAKDLNLNYLDTGAMYRLVTLKILEENIDISDKQKIMETLKNTKLDIKDNKFYLDNRDVTEKIRSQEVSNNVSKIASLKIVRKNLVKKQREIAQEKRAILDGRDIGTVVFPNAELKIYLNATIEERARRRYREYQEKGIDSDYKDIYEEIQKRDKQDMNREIGALKKAKDSIEIDTTELSIDDVVSNIEELIHKQILDKMLG